MARCAYCPSGNPVWLNMICVPWSCVSGTNSKILGVQTPSNNEKAPRQKRIETKSNEGVANNNLICFGQIVLEGGLDIDILHW